MSIPSEDVKKNYSWRYDVDPVPGLPMVDSLIGLLPRFSWLKKSLKAAVSVIINVNQYGSISFESELHQRQMRAIYVDALKLEDEFSKYDDDDESHFDSLFQKHNQLLNTFFEFLHALPQSTKEQEEAREYGLDKFDSMFQTIDRPFVADAQYIHNDKLFAYWRVAGNNPVTLKRINAVPNNFPLTQAQFASVMEGDELELALKENRVFIVDYKVNGKMAVPEGYHKPASGIGYSTAPVALFAVSKSDKSLNIVAIQCGQDPKESEIFLPSDDKQMFWGWQMAKTAVQVADENFHEMYTHLGLTHFFSEVFAVATLRLPETHVLYKLLITHFEGTNFINYAATKILMQPGQFVDVLFAASLDNIGGELLQNRFDYDISENMLPVFLKKRGLDDIDTFPDYPYRDDGLLIWNAIYAWVSDYVSHYYWSDAQLQSDPVVMQWSDDILQNGKIKGFEPVTTVSSLKDVLTMAIFVASAQHAAVNFTQPDWMLYAPAMSATQSAKAPYSQNGHTNEDWLHMLPKYNQALEKITIYSLLGGVCHGRLGDYLKPGAGEALIFDDIRIHPLLAKFRNQLADIEGDINERNKSRFIPYTYLLPSNIPASTNI